jgi:hypothetical protein
MMKFESDLAPATDLPYGYEDSLDAWLEEQEMEAAWAVWQELTFDPDA